MYAVCISQGGASDTDSPPPPVRYPLRSYGVHYCTHHHPCDVDMVNHASILSIHALYGVSQCVCVVISGTHHHPCDVVVVCVTDPTLVRLGARRMQLPVGQLTGQLAGQLAVFPMVPADTSYICTPRTYVQCAGVRPTSPLCLWRRWESWETLAHLEGIANAAQLRLHHLWSAGTRERHRGSP